MKDSESWLIIGAGAIGLLWYSKLVDLKINVTLLHRNQKHLKTLIVEDNKETRQYSLSEISSHQNGSNTEFNNTAPYKFKNILFCTKSFDLINAYQSNTHNFTDDATLVTLCNGMGAQQELSKHITLKQSLFIGTTNEGALKLGANKIKKTGKGDVYVGNPDSAACPPAPFNTYFTDAINEKLLTKLAINSVINPLTAFFQITNGQLLATEFKPYYLSCRDEVCEFLSALGLDKLTLEKTIDQVAINTKDNRSSMLQDVCANKQTEIDFISGYFVSLGKKHQRSLPIQAFLHSAITNKHNHKTCLSELNKLPSF